MTRVETSEAIPDGVELSDAASTQLLLEICQGLQAPRALAYQGAPSWTAKWISLEPALVTIQLDRARRQVRLSIDTVLPGPRDLSDEGLAVPRPWWLQGLLVLGVPLAALSCGLLTHSVWLGIVVGLHAAFGWWTLARVRDGRMRAEAPDLSINQAA